MLVAWAAVWWGLLREGLGGPSEHGWRDCADFLRNFLSLQTSGCKQRLFLATRSKRSVTNLGECDSGVVFLEGDASTVLLCVFVYVFMCVVVCCLCLCVTLDRLTQQCTDFSRRALWPTPTPRNKTRNLQNKAQHVNNTRGGYFGVALIIAHPERKQQGFLWAGPHPPLCTLARAHSRDPWAFWHTTWQPMGQLSTSKFKLNFNLSFSQSQNRYMGGTKVRHRGSSL